MSRQGERGSDDRATWASNLQRRAGNRATTGLLVGRPSARALRPAASAPATDRVQRAPLTQLEKEQNLTSARYGGDPDLEKAFDNSPPFKYGSGGDAVAKVQQGFVDDGFPMPKSTENDGSTDGIYKSESKSVATQFQVKHGLASKDGSVGRQTMGKLDELAGGPAPGRKPEIDATTKAMGERVAASMTAANTVSGPDKGIWYDYNYHSEHVADPATYPWDEDWRNGFADPTLFDRLDWMKWRLKPGVSASEGIKSWLRGLTIAECLSAIVAMEIDTMRAAVGDDKFDAAFGSTSAAVPESRRLLIQTGTAGTPIEGMLIDAHGSGPGEFGTIGNRPTTKGDWVYFYNHPRYLLKHPGGAWQGENAVYMGDDSGEQLWSGLGAGPYTERDMLQEMADSYNAARDADDHVRLLERHAADAPEVATPNQQYLDRDETYLRSLYVKYLDRMPSDYRADSGEFPDTVTVQDILDDPPYTIGPRTRKGGYLPSAASRLDETKVAAMRNS